MRHDVETRIKIFLEKETQKKINGYEEDLIATGALDSFSVIALIHYIEAEFGVAANMEELNQNNFNSIRAIAAMIRKWK